MGHPDTGRTQLPFVSPSLVIKVLADIKKEGC